MISEIEAMGGAERSVLALSRWLFKRELDHYIVTYVDHIGIAAHADHPVTVVELRPSMRASKKIRALGRHFAARRGAPAPLMSSYQPALHATLAGLRGFHCLLHDTPSLLENEIASTTTRRIRRWLSDKIAAHGLKSGGKTIVTSEYLREETWRVFHVQADIARMGGLSNPEAFRIRRVTSRLQMLSVSRIESNKRIDWILRSLAAMERSGTPLSSRLGWDFNIAGTGSRIEALRTLSGTLGLSDRVHFLGFVSDEEWERLYREAHLFLMPAVQGYGIPAIEALVRGLPVLLHRDSGVSDILRETAWATVIEGGEEGMLPGLRKAIDAVIEGAQCSVPLPVLPTEEEWAERVTRLCGWIE
jgi:glycosyltransferase involved in cell wall biosynthesis